MITGKLSNGYEISVDEKKCKTYQFSKLVGKACSKNNEERLYANAQILEYLIGEEGETELLAYVEKQTGEEPTSEGMTALILEIIKLMENKNEEIKKSDASEES